MSVDLNQLLQRCADLEKAALADIGKTADSQPFFYWTQGTFPYFTNRIRGEPIQWDSEDFRTPFYTVVMRLIIDHRTAGSSANEPETNLYAYMTQVLDYFDSRQLLLDDTFTTEIPYLVNARMADTPSFTIFQNSGTPGVEQVGCEFSLRCEFEEEIQQVYD